MNTNFGGRGQGIQRGGFGRDIHYGGHDSAPPAPADMDDGRQRVASSGGQPGAGASPSEILAVNEHIQSQDRGIEYGQTEAVSNYQQMRVEQWKRKTGWDGDLNYPPPGFLEQEAERNHRIDFIDRKQQREAGYPGAGSKFMIASPLEDHNAYCHRAALEAGARNLARTKEAHQRFFDDQRRAQDRQQMERDRAHAREMQQMQQAQFQRDRDLTRQMQQAQFDHEARMRQMELMMQRYGGRR